MIDNPQSHGPDEATLKHLAGMLPSFTKALVEGRVQGKGRKAPKPMVPQPTKICIVCAATFDLKPRDHYQEVLLKGKCPKCQELLDQRYIAFVSGNEFMFAKHPDLQDLQGKVVRLKPVTFNEVKKKYQEKKDQCDDAP